MFKKMIKNFRKGFAGDMLALGMGIFVGYIIKLI